MISIIKKSIYAKIIVLLGAVFIILMLVFFAENDTDKTLVQDIQESISDYNHFDDISIEARSAFVWDVNKQKALFETNPNVQLPLASLTKLMTAIAANDILPDKSIVTINNASLTSEGDSGLYENEKWNFKDLMRFTLVVSSNDGASAVANVAGLFENDFPSKEEDNKKSFVQAMNEKAREIGLTQTYFINPTGLDTNETVSGGYGSARDAARLLEYAVINMSEIVESTRHTAIAFESLSDINHFATNTNSSIDRVPGLIASKTGYTDLAGGNLVIAFDAGMNRPIIISVLGSTQDGRFEDIKKLVDASLKSLY
jgi:serine-type D-Ala-D-Ala carboxypeptidase (penicillin-binding protein 5/6)